MIKVFYTKTFIKKFSKLDPALQEDVAARVDYFKDTNNHKRLKVHKLKKPFLGVYAFSVNYKIRVLFAYREQNKEVVLLLTVGGHDLYQK